MRNTLRSALCVFTCCIASANAVAKPQDYHKDCDNSMNGKRYCVSDSHSKKSFDSEDSAAWSVAQTVMKDRECLRDWESSYLVYEKNGEYYYGTPQFFSDKAFGGKHAPVDLNHKYVQDLRDAGYNVVAVVHPHPGGSWFSEQDAKTAKKMGIDCYMLPCPTSLERHISNKYMEGQVKMYVLDHNDGVVYPIDRGRRGAAILYHSGGAGSYQGVSQYSKLNDGRGLNELGENIRKQGILPSTASFSIDTSRLEALLKEGISFLKRLIAKGKRATRSQIEEHNQRVCGIAKELENIAKQVDALDASAEERKRICEKALAKVDGLKSQFCSLCEQAKSMGLVDEASDEQKKDLAKDVQGETSRGACGTRTKSGSSAAAEGSSEGGDMSDEEAIGQLREDGSGMDAVLDALKE